jgi:cytoskeletal protein CcmA (bactofilin family)
MKDFLRSLNNVVSPSISSQANALKIRLISQFALLRKPQQPQPQPSMAKLLDAKSVFKSDVKIQGQLHCNENLVIDGLYQGHITAQNNTVAVGSSGQVSADIIAKKVIVEGEVIGDISAEDKVVLTASGTVTGNIKAAVVDLENGARFKGIIEMDPQLANIIDEQLDLESKAIAIEPN